MCSPLSVHCLWFLIMQSQKVTQYNVNAAVLHAPSACLTVLQQCLSDKCNSFNLPFSLFHWIFCVIHASLVLVSVERGIHLAQMTTGRAESWLWTLRSLPAQVGGNSPKMLCRTDGSWGVPLCRQSLCVFVCLASSWELMFSRLSW